MTVTTTAEAALSLAGRTALITGANRGIGWRIAQLFATHGARVILNHPSADATFPTAIAAIGRDALSLIADVSSPAAVAAMFAALVDREITVDILVNNAGIFPRCEVLDISLAEWDQVINTNLRGAFLCSQYAARQMVAHGGGHIINIASTAALTGATRGAHYSASKAGLIALTSTFAKALAPFRIRVNAIAPGLTDTAQPALSRRDAIAHGRAIPLGRVGVPTDVANVALFLASSLSDYVTGETVRVCGGAT